MIEAQQLIKSYNSLKVLKGVSLKIEKGEVISIVGASGAGKSTLLHILGTLDQPDQGKLFINNTDVFSLKSKAISAFRNKEIGFVFQSFHLLAKNSALNNVLLPLKYAGVKQEEAYVLAKNVLDKVGLSDRVNHAPSELSGGQQQRVAIARALVNKPSIVFADEPTGNLDSKTGDDVMELFKELNSQGQTIILITHEEQFMDMIKELKYLVVKEW